MDKKYNTQSNVLKFWAKSTRTERITRITKQCVSRWFFKGIYKQNKNILKEHFSCYGHALSIIISLNSLLPPKMKTDYFTIAFPNNLILKNLSSVPCSPFVLWFNLVSFLFFLSYFLVRVMRRISIYLRRIFRDCSSKYYFKMESGSFLLHQHIKC